jgi:ribose transport system ATP-binding protein
MEEVCLCDRVYVFREGAVVAELTGEAITEDNILAASFAGAAA